ncbi:MAG: LamG domain-containing protein [Phycisphaerae bacterium]|jgi:predicted outer membrane repeat protein
MRSSLFVFVCVTALIMAVASQATPGGDGYADDGGRLRQGRTDCNNNGIADAIEVGPLDGHALLFDGVDDYVDPGASAVLDDLGQGNFTLEAWVCTTDEDHGVLIGNGGGAASMWNLVIRGFEYGGVIRLRINDGVSEKDCLGTVSVTDGAWHHVAAVRRLGTGSLAIFIDGVLDTEVAEESSPFSSVNPTYIGRDARTNPPYFEGAMDDVRVWNTARSEAEIAADMYRVLKGDEWLLAAYWRFDEGAGTIASDSAGDSDGDLVGPPAWLAIADDCNGSGVPDECETLPTGVIYVDDDAGGGLNDGSSWADAFVELRDALAYAECTGQITEIRVAGGTYKPGTVPNESFDLQNGVALRGGYRGLAGGGGPDDRDIAAFESILSGDIGVIDDTSDNSNHVVAGRNVDASAVIEGFTITKGNGTSGSGARIVQGSPTIAYCTFSRNKATYGGGMAIVEHSAPTLISCTFSRNSADLRGGGVYNDDHSDPTLIYCTFSRNSAVHSGGGVCSFDQGNSTLTCCVFSGNSADYGGAAYNNESDQTLANCTFCRNSATYGGGAIYNSWYSSAVVQNCTLWANTAASGPQIDGDESVTTATYSCIQGGWPGEGNISANPFFVDADGPDDIPGTEDDDLRLMPTASPCIDAGSNAIVPADTFDLDDDGDTTEPIPFDVAGNARFVNDVNRPDGGEGESPVVDMGAFESVGQVAGSADLDGDGDVDIDDFELFQQQFTGPLP